MKYIVGKIKPFYVFHISASVLMQIVALVLVYILTPEDYGYLALITSVAQIMFILCSGWNNAVLVNLGTKYYQEKGSYNNIVLYRFILISVCLIVLSLLFCLLENPITHFVGSASNYSLVYIFFLGLVFYDYVYQILYPGDKNMLQSGVIFSVNVIILLYVLFFVTTIREYVVFNTIAKFVLFFVLCGLFYYYYGKKGIKYNHEEFKEVFRFSAWQLFGVIGIYLINIGTNYVLRFYDIPVAEIGLYNFAYKLFCGFVPFFALLGVIIPKWMYNKNIECKGKYIFKRLKYYYLFLLTLYLLLYFLLPYFLVFINKTDYMGSVRMYLLLFPGFLFYVANQMMNPIILNTSYFKYTQFIAITQGVTLFVVSFILVGLFGMYGALLANIMSFFVGSVCVYYLYKKKISVLLQS